MKIVLLALLVAGGALAQRHKVNINTETPEGQALQQIGQESDEAKKLAAYEKFTQDYPKSENLAWVYGEMQPLYVKANQPDKAVEAGEKIMALDPEDLDTALATLKASEAKKDPDLVKKWSATTAALAQKSIASPQPKDEDAVEDWKKHVDYAKQVNTYSEYAVDAMALQTTDPRKKVDLIESLFDRDPQSQYMPQLIPAAVQALQQMNDPERSTAFAEKILAKDPNNDEMLLVAANGYSQKGKEPDKVIAYSNKLVEVLGQKAKPEGVAEADWTKRNNVIMCLAHYWPGKVYYSQKKYGPAGKELQTALSLSDANPALKPELLFMLGDSAYRQENIVEALKYFQQCAAIKSGLQAQATKNVAAIKAQYRAVK